MDGVKVDAEKVCKGFECCYMDKSPKHCEGCPYNMDNEGCGHDTFALERDALALIRQQAEEIHALKTKIHELQTARQWISVNDRLPPMYHMVLITGKNSAGGSFGVIKGSHDGDKGQWYRDDIGSYVDSRGDTITHWMPLPEPPKEGSQV